jgi:primosomal protein N' (replication factor Y)
LPGEEATESVAAIGASLLRGRRAIVIVPEAEPLPFTAVAVLEEFGDRAVNFVGGEPRERYGNWLGILSGRYDVVVGTRPSVFAPLRDLGLLWVSREVHPGHREERAPYYHVREVAMARARLHGAACVMASYSPSVETGVGIEAGEIRVRRAPRQMERARAPLVETTPPEGEDRSGRLARLLKSVPSAALIVSRRGYGVARVCKACRQPAACAVCRGAIALERGVAACVVCGAAGRCANCGAGIFGVERGGVERIVEWGARIAEAPVFGSSHGGPHVPGHGAVIVGTAASVNDVGPLELDLVAILDPDRALARPGVHSGERAVSTWMEAAAWARPREQGGRVLAQTRRPGHPAIQALVRWDPDPFIRSEATARKESGFPAGYPVFRIEGTSRLEDELRDTRPETLLATGDGDRTVCLVAVHPARLAVFRSRVVSLAAEGVVTRVEAEPQL